MRKKIIFIIILLFFVSINVKAAFPNSISDLRHIDYCNCNSKMSCSKVCYQGPSTNHIIMKFGLRVDQIDGNNTNSIMHYEGKQKDSNYPDEDYKARLVLLCTNFHFASPVPASTGTTRKTDDRCTRITSKTANGYWSNPIKAGVATIIRKMLNSNAGDKAHEYDNEPKYFAYYDTKKSSYGAGGSGYGNDNYYRASSTITKFTFDKNVKGVTEPAEFYQKWLDAANAEYDKVKNMKVEITNVRTANDATSFYVKVDTKTEGGSTTITTSFYDSSDKEISATKQTSGTYKGYYKILKSSLNEGDNSITVKVTSEYETYIAQNYDCGKCNGGNGCTKGARLQTISPSYVESKTFKKEAEKTFSLTKESKGDLTIRIINQKTKNLISSETAKFTIHEGTGCTGTVVDTKSTNLGTTGKINLTSGTYSIKEVDPRIDNRSYKRVSSTDCVVNSVTIPSGKNITKDIEYIPQCEVRLTEIIANHTKWSDTYIDELIKLYNDGNSSSKNLLNFDNPSCTASVCDRDLQIGCLTANTNSNFSERNLSCYDEGIQDANGNYIGFCQTNYTLTNNIGDSFYSKSGRLLIEQDGGVIKMFEKNGSGEVIEKKIENNYIATSNTIKTCYTIGDQSIGNELDEYNVYFGDNNDNGEADPLPSDTYDEPQSKQNANYGFVKHTLKRVQNYKLNEIYFEKITGKYTNVYDAEKTTSVVHGVLTKFNSSNGSVLFKINDTSSTACSYNSDKEIIKYDDSSSGKLDLEFRTIDTNNPFNRTPKSNWNDGSNEGNSDNELINNYILKATNSYGMKKGYGETQTPIYTIRLTPDLIKSIRDYNNGTGEYAGESHTYDEYLLECDEDEYGNNVCRNSFLNEFNIIRVG